MALEYTSLITPIESLDEAIDLYGLVLFAMTPGREPALIDPTVFRGIEYSGNINGPYSADEYDKLITKSNIDTFFGVGGRGTVDYKGAQGPQGTQGLRGDASSLRGYQGIPGEDGDLVAQGLQGYQGVQGLQGLMSTSRGYQGLQGPKGGAPEGTQGVQGTQGLTGYQGYPGASNIRGTQGYQGYRGIQGAQGTTGDPFVLNWTSLRSLFSRLGITLGDNGVLSGVGLRVTDRVISANGFYKS